MLIGKRLQGVSNIGANDSPENKTGQDEVVEGVCLAIYQRGFGPITRTAFLIRRDDGTLDELGLGSGRVKQIAHPKQHPLARFFRWCFGECRDTCRGHECQYWDGHRGNHRSLSPHYVWDSPRSIKCPNH